MLLNNDSAGQGCARLDRQGLQPRSSVTALLCTLQAGHCWRCLTGSILPASVSLGHLATSAPWNLLEPPGKCQAQGDRLAGLVW